MCDMVWEVHETRWPDDHHTIAVFDSEANARAFVEKNYGKIQENQYTGLGENGRIATYTRLETRTSDADYEILSWEVES